MKRPLYPLGDEVDAERESFLLLIASSGRWLRVPGSTAPVKSRKKIEREDEAKERREKMKRVAIPLERDAMIEPAVPEHPTKGLPSVSLPAPWARADVTPLAPEASTRRFYRLSRGRDETAILMLFQDSHDIDPFVVSTAYLAGQNLPVPELVEIDREQGWVITQDLGPMTLDQAVDAGHDEGRLYDHALTLLKRLAAADAPPPSIGSKRLDESLFRREGRHTLEWFVRAWANVDVPEERVLEELDELSTCLDAQPRAICHRDYHSRNLVVGPRGLGIVDHQDVQPGPFTYDVASLIKDAYRDVPQPIQDEFTSWIQARGATLRDLDVAIAQRTFKALGTFGYQVVERGNRRYEEAIPRTIQNVLGALERLEMAPEIRALLGKVAP